MLTKYEPQEYLNESKKHKTRAEELEAVLPELDSIETFEIGRAPQPVTQDDREYRVTAACEMVDYSAVHSWNLYRRAVAAHIAVDMDYRADEMQMRQDGDHTQEIIMWEPRDDQQLFGKLRDNEYLEIVREEYQGDDVVYTMECDFDQYYQDELA